MVNYLESECFIYIEKNKIDWIKSQEDFIPSENLLENSDVREKFYNTIGTYLGKIVVIK